MQGPPPYTQSTPGHHGGAEMHGEERSYGIVLLLYIVTLGIYGLYWHYKTHDELCQQVGRENKDKSLWFVYIAIHAVVFVMLLVLLVLFVAMLAQEADAVEAGGDVSEEFIFSFVASVIGFVVFLVIAMIAQLVLFVVYVLRQFNLLDEVHKRTGEQMRLSGGAFMGLYFGAIVVNIVPFIGGLVAIAMEIIAYYLFQENYNGVWRGIKQGRPVPTDVQWATGGARPPMPGAGAWDAPQGHARLGAPDMAPSGPAGPASTAPPAPPAAAGAGFSVGSRGPGAPLGKLVHQTFECPRCRTHIPASGAPNAQVEIRCTQCGEGGRVTLPSD